MTDLFPPDAPTRTFVAFDADGVLFTAEELRTTVLHSWADPVEAAELAAGWTDHPPEDPNASWSEGLLLLIALHHPHRAERIRRVIGDGADPFAARLELLRQSLPL